MLYTSTLLHWLQRKRYQYEVTFSLYMLTPTEKFIFSSSTYRCLPLALAFIYRDNAWFQHADREMANSDSFLFLFLSMIIIAASLYLPEHIATVLSRAWFYYAGDDTAHPSVGGSEPKVGDMGNTGSSE